jgi:hypothetical protein
MSAIITDDFRRNNADAFVAAINTLATDSPVSQSTGYYVGIGKSDPWLDDNSPPSPTGSEIERQDVRQNLISMKLIESNEVERLLPKTNQNWVTGRPYKAYDPTDRTCFNQTIVGSSINEYACYVIYGGVLYLCLSNNAGGNSTVTPSSAAAADGDVGQNDGDSYIWTRIGTIPTLSDFVDSSTFFEIPPNLSSGVIDTKGLLYGFKVVNGGAGYSAVDGDYAATLRYTQLDGTTATAAVRINIVFGVVTSVGSATSSPLGDPIALSEFQGFGVGASNGIRKASVMFDSEPSYTTRADIQPLFAPAAGFGADNLDVFPPFYVGIAADFVGGDANAAGTNETLVDTKFRQVSILKNIDMTADDSPEAYGVVNSLQRMNLSASISLTSDSYRYFIVDGSGEKAWIDYIDSTNDYIYFHQNGAADVTQDAIPSSGTVTVYNSSDVSMGDFAYGSITAPEHDAYSGDVIMVDNRVPILRSSVQTEKVRIILQF